MEKFVEKYDKQIHRAFEMIPGLLTWSFMLSPIWLGLIYPPAIIWLITFLTVYWCYLSLKGTIGLMIGYPRYKTEMETDWMKEIGKLKYKKLPDKTTVPTSIEDTKHFLLIPCVNEPFEVLQPAIQSFFNQTYPLNKITLVFTLEEKWAEQTKKTILEILGKDKNKFEEVLIYVHPKGIPGEAIGVGGANRTWGAKHAVEHFAKKKKIIKNYIFSSFDSDHVLDKQYLARLTHLYLNTVDRNNKFYATSVHLFNNNHWRVPAVMRIEANFVTMGTLAGRSFPWGIGHLTRDTFAAYSTSLQTLIDADYWDVTLGIDDTIFYWRAFFKRNGYFRCESHYIPYSADAVEGKNYIDSYVSLYKQLLRWGWGVIEVPYSLKGFLTNKNIAWQLKIFWLYDHFKTRTFLINIVVLITFGFSIVTFINPQVRQSSFTYTLPNIMSIILTFALIFIIPGTYYRSKITVPMPKDWPWYKKLFGYSEGFLVIVNLLTFSFFPFIDAQTRLLFGKRMKDLYHTPKVR